MIMVKKFLRDEFVIILNHKCGKFALVALRSEVYFSSGGKMLLALKVWRPFSVTAVW